MKIKHLTSGANVSPLLWAIQSNPNLWDENKSRTESPDSPHHELNDIWVRWAAPGIDGSKPHESIWYPCVEVLPVKPLVMPLMTALGGEQLGGVLITKIPAGKTCKPHKDPGWHARYYQKFAIQIQSAPGQKFCFEGEELEPIPGDVYWFDNQYTHWVTNDTPYDRITMIVCVKTNFTGA